MSRQTTVCEPRYIYRYHAMVVDLVQITPNQRDENWVPWTRLGGGFNAAQPYVPGPGAARARNPACSGRLTLTAACREVSASVSNLFPASRGWRCAFAVRSPGFGSREKERGTRVHSGKVKVLPRRFRSLGAVRPVVQVGFPSDFVGQAGRAVRPCGG